MLGFIDSFQYILPQLPHVDKAGHVLTEQSPIGCNTHPINIH